MTRKRENSPGVIAPPPLIYLAVIVIGYGLDWLWPLPFIARPVAYGIGGLLLVAGVVINLWGFFAFRRTKTSLNPYKPDSALIETGPFRYSRNPLYVTIALITAGIACLFESVWMLAMLIPALVVIRVGVISREEAYLERQFGDAYRDYKARVRRWL